MSVFKCKMCGGTIEFEPGAGVGVCDHCGTKQTLPRLDDDRKANLYDRADHFRRNNDFDKAAGIYEMLLNEDKTDAEAYWLLVLCRYGVEYVEDPASHKRIPTVNRAQYTSIFDDADYRSALEYADAQQRSLYESEAAAINEIQKGILAISQKEEPFDVFICYKETDAQGRRTPDSVLATDLYHQLVNEGFKVFFSRITLEDKLGTAYEPYIFAALNSAKVMVVLGTKPEYFNAVWVKNEWSRYLALVKASNGKKVLIPAYRDMDPYDLPEEFSHLQAQDMSRLGFMQDLLRGIKKLTKKDTPQLSMAKETVERETVGGVNVRALLKRAFMYLEDGDWAKADDFCEQVLNQEPENAQAYLGKLMAEMHAGTREALVDCEEPFDKSGNYQKVVRFGDEKLAEMLKGYVENIKSRNLEATFAEIYRQAIKGMEFAEDHAALLEFDKADALFEVSEGALGSIKEYRDAEALSERCRERREECRKDDAYYKGMNHMDYDMVIDYEAAIEYFRKIPCWRDADEQIELCKKKIKELTARQKADQLEQEHLEMQKRIAAEKSARKAARKRRLIISVFVAVIVGCAAYFSVWRTILLPQQKLDEAVLLINSGDAEAGYALLEELEGFIASRKYDQGLSFLNYGNFEAAYKLLNHLNYKDSAKKAAEIRQQYCAKLLSSAAIGSSIYFGAYELDEKSSDGKEDIEWQVLAKDGDKVLVISKYLIDGRPYHKESTNVTWETCSLRKWLNETFLNEAFSDFEQEMIQNTVVTAEKNPKYDTDPGNDTTDKIFLLSIGEVDRYFNSDSARKSTSYSFMDNDFIIYFEWWLRSPGNEEDCAAFVYGDGDVALWGSSVERKWWVRPALWISPEA